MAILDEALGGAEPLIPEEVLAKVRELNLSTPRSAADMIRKDRDDR